MDAIHRWDNESRDSSQGYLGSQADLQGTIAGFFKAGLYDAAHPPPAWMEAWHRRRMLETPKHVILACVHGSFENKDTLGREEVAIATFKGKIAGPWLVVGSSEEWVRVDRGLIPEGPANEVLVIGEAGHWMHQVASEKFNSELKRWLGKAGLVPN